MINVITGFGSSFKGLSAYLLHDIDSTDTSERVAWTHTHNLATEDPAMAARIMAATAMSQAELKAEAGIKNTGRKSHNSVCHYVLSWSPDEHGQYSKDEMIDAALASMTYIGATEGERIGKKRVAKRTQYADEHQAVIVCHDEGPGKNPHVHIMLNRVHPEHGVMVTDSKDYEKLSAWALDYRQAEGKEHLCPERVKNAAKKAQGVLTSHARKPRNVYEREQEIDGCGAGSRKKALLEQQARRAKGLKAKTEAMKRDQAEAMRGLEDRLVVAERDERAKSGEAIKASTSKIRADYAPKIDALTKRQTNEISAFNDAKENFRGRIRNTWAAFKTKQWMTEIRTDPINAMKHSFALAFDSGLQQRDIEKHHANETGKLNGQRTAEERDAARGVRTDEGFKLDEIRQGYHVERNDLILEQSMDKAKLKAEWKQLELDRRAVESEDERGPDPQHEQELSSKDSGARSGGSRKSPQALSPQSDQAAAPKVDPARGSSEGDEPKPKAKRPKNLLEKRQAKAKQRAKSRENDRGKDGLGR